MMSLIVTFYLQAEDGIRDDLVTGVQTCALPIYLSTFSGHMANIASILTAVGGRDLVLLDEVGTGTSPKEGEAIAFAVISYLIKKHAFTLVSSHFEGLKAYALSHEEITNASMVFDEEKLLPTYKLKMGLPGESYGLIVARRFRSE